MEQQDTAAAPAWECWPTAGSRRDRRCSSGLCLEHGSSDTGFPIIYLIIISEQLSHLLSKETLWLRLATLENKLLFSWQICLKLCIISNTNMQVSGLNDQPELGEIHEKRGHLRQARTVSDLSLKFFDLS